MSIIDRRPEVLAPAGVTPVRSTFGALFMQRRAAGLGAHLRGAFVAALATLLVTGSVGTVQGMVPDHSATLGQVLERFERGDEPAALYDFYQPDLIRLKFGDTLQVRIRDTGLTDLWDEHGQGATLAPLLLALRELNAFYSCPVRTRHRRPWVERFLTLPIRRTMGRPCSAY